MVPEVGVEAGRALVGAFGQEAADGAEPALARCQLNPI